MYLKLMIDLTQFGIVTDKQFFLSYLIILLLESYKKLQYSVDFKSGNSLFGIVSCLFKFEIYNTYHVFLQLQIPMALELLFLDDLFI